MAITLALLVPTVIFVNLRFPRWRPVLDAVSLLPLGVPAVVIVLGVLGAYRSLPNWFMGTPVILALIYVILALPYSYRAIDAGVRSIDLRTLVDAGRSMGAGWGKLLAPAPAAQPPLGDPGRSLPYRGFVAGRVRHRQHHGFQHLPGLAGRRGRQQPLCSRGASIAALVVTWLLLVVLALAGSAQA